MPSQKSTTHHDPFSPEHIRATWSGTASVEDAAQAFGLSRSKSYDLVRRVLESGEPEYNTASSASTKPS
ncbi:hypothetical protein [Streptomyces sp. NRRL WC-3703]|uniref:hypothetical protein n=1 Tax=Streptomyces sp. NRRL WC-3703 TaxID=1463930 RepID=UPI0004C558E5|nr:hypothetical protein [Streptomyces sp. NRRL WC-3703]